MSRSLSDYPSFTLRLTNLMIGLCRGAPGLPRALRELGYEGFWVELRFAIAGDKAVNPDMIVYSTEQRHTLLCEWKSGRNVEKDQLLRYGLVTDEDLRVRAHIPAAAAAAHDTTVFGVAEYRERLVLGLTAAESDAVLVVVDDEGLTRVGRRFAADGLNAAFAPRPAVDVANAPLGFLPFDAESPDHVVAEHCIRQLVVYMNRREPLVRLSALAQDVVSIWSVLPDDARKPLTDRMRDIMTEAARYEFRPYLHRERGIEGRTRTPTWGIANNPLDLSTEKRTAAYRRLEAAQKGLVERLRSNGGRSQGELPLEFAESD